MINTSVIDVSRLTDAWQQVHSLAHDAIAPIDTEAQYDRALAALDTLLAEVGENSSHPLADLVEGLISRIVAYQDNSGHVPPAAADMELRLLMNERHVTQSALAEATGIAQAQISRLMNGKRAFTAEHARRFARFFQVGPEVFLCQTEHLK